MEEGLQRYLNRYFPNGKCGEIGGQAVVIDRHFIDKFGVKVVNEDDLFLFNYSDQEAVFAFPITRECRGIILRYSPDGWEVVARPFAKFWNHFDPICPLYEPEDFAKLAPELQIVEKLDGTMITCWYDLKTNKWRLSTRGAITPQKCSDFQGAGGDSVDGTYSDLFIKTAGNINWDLLDKKNTHIFELCTFANRVFSRYEMDMIFLLAARETQYGVYVPYSMVDELAVDLACDNMIVSSPSRIFLSELGITTKSEFESWVEEQYDKPGGTVENPEGYVVYHGCKPMAKFKSKKYLEASVLYSGGNFSSQRRKITHAFFGGWSDDLKEAVVPEMASFVEDLKERLKILYGIAVSVKSDLHLAEKVPEDRKEFASFLEAKCAILPLRAMFFRIGHEKLWTMSYGEFKEYFDNWVSKNYENFDDYWKGKKGFI